MPSFSQIRTANAAFAPSYLPVAVFVGGTSGIGEAMAKAFARYTKGNARIIIVGRNKAAAESIIASFPKPTVASESGPLHEFVHCDATLMKNVHATAKDLLAKLHTINFLILSPGYLATGGRDETEEGIDKRLALNYYARWRFIYDLVPLLQKAKDNGEDSKVLSVMAAGMGGKIDVNDLGLKTTYSFMNTFAAAPTYNDLMLESFAEQHPDIAFTHIYPGGVRTPILWVKMHWILTPLAAIIYSLAYLASKSPDTCAEYMWYGVFEGQKGFHRRGEKGNDIGQKGYYGSEEARKLLWDHTVEATKVSA